MLAAIPSRAAEPAPDPAPGQLLIASAAMQDPRFHHSVILLLHHDNTGAFGLVINRPVAEEPIAKLLAGAGKAEADPADKKLDLLIQVFLGGPVQPELGFVVHSAEYSRPETLHVDDAFAMTASRDILRDIGQHRGPKKYLFALGYAGWGADQLEGEIARRDWFTAPAEPELVFDTERGQVWERALARRTREL